MSQNESRPLTLFDVTCIGVNAIIGSSIFLFPGKLAALLGPASVLAFVLTGLLLISIGLCFAEAAGRFDGHGGPYLYARAAFGNEVGFGIGWMCWLTQCISWAAVANAVAVYMGYFKAGLGAGLAVKVVAFAIIAVMGGINYRGVKLAAWTTNAFTLGKLVPLALLIVVGIPFVDWSNFRPFAPLGLKPLGPACFLAYFAYQGFEAVPVPAGEVVDARKNLPKAVIWSILFSGAVYCLIQTVAVGLVPTLAESERPLADAAAAVLGPFGAGLVALGAVISTIGYNAGSALGGPRYLVALGEQGDFSPRFAQLHPAFKTPHWSIVATSAFTLVLAMALDFNKLVDIGNVVICAQFISTAAALPVLRKKLGMPDGFVLPGGPAIPVIAIASTVWLGAQGGLDQVYTALALLASGFAVRYSYRRWARR